MVQLKAGSEQGGRIKMLVSIPNGSIKSKSVFRDTAFVTCVSIPNGSIKRVVWYLIWE